MAKFWGFEHIFDPVLSGESSTITLKYIFMLERVSILTCSVGKYMLCSTGSQLRSKKLLAIVRVGSGNWNEPLFAPTIDAYIHGSLAQGTYIPATGLTPGRERLV